MGDRITCQPCWFKIGDKCAIEVKEQVTITNVLIGDVAGDQETRGLQGWVYKVGFTRLGLQGWVYKVGFTRAEKILQR